MPLIAEQWRVLDSGASDGMTNMATDVALLAHARRTGEATLRVYAWARPTLSLGRHERAAARFDRAALATRGVDVVRRPTGGRALLHHREVTYSVTAPVGPMALSESYRAINTLLLQAFAILGVAAEVATRAERTLRPEGAACFAEPASGELIARGAKLVGSAQLRENGAWLQHGSILIADDQPLIESLLAPVASAAAPTVAAATLEGILGRTVGYSEVRDALVGALNGLGAHGMAGTSSRLGSPRERPAPPIPLDPESLRDDLARLVIAFADPDWTWRR